MKSKDSLDNCLKCGAKIRNKSNSFLIWEIEYRCGCRIYGAIGDKAGKFDYIKKCKNE